MILLLSIVLLPLKYAIAESVSRVPQARVIELASGSQEILKFGSLK